MTKTSTEQYNWLLNKAKKDENIIGIILSGSRGKGLGKEYSDYDLSIIILPNKEDYIQKHYIKQLSPEFFDIGIMTLEELEEYARWGTDSGWDAYSFAYLQLPLDKTDGELQRIINKKTIIPEEIYKKYVAGYLDGYINAVYRSFKALRDKNYIGYRMEGASSIGILLKVLFAIHGRRIVPYYKYLEWELENYPLTKLPWTGKELLQKILAILETADYRVQQTIFEVCYRIFKEEGFGHIFDAWEGEEKWIMKFKPKESF